jgi:hypothetical protein
MVGMDGPNTSASKSPISFWGRILLMARAKLTGKEMYYVIFKDADDFENFVYLQQWISPLLLYKKRLKLHF